jgi:hypothetical protein
LDEDTRMRTTFHPRRLLLTAVLIIGLSVVLALATSERHEGVLGMAGVVAYLLFDMLFTVNPAVWWRDRR